MSCINQRHLFKLDNNLNIVYASHSSLYRLSFISMVFVKMFAKKELSWTVRKRIIELRESGLTFGNISNMLEVPKSTIRNTIDRWKRYQTCHTLPRPGRPRKITERTARKLVRKVMSKPFTSRGHLQTELKMDGLSVSKNTISRVLHRGQLKSRKPRKVPLMKRKR